FVMGPLAFLVHPTAVVLVPAACIGIMAMDAGRFRSSRPALLLLWCLVIAAVNAVWIAPLVSYLGVKTPSTAFFQMAGIQEAASLIMRPGSLPAAALVVFAFGGMLTLVREKRFSVLVPAAGASAVLLAIAGYGCQIACIDQMEPGRFLVSFLLFLSPLAGVGLCGFMKAVERRFPSGGTRWKYALTVLIFLAPLWLSFIESKTLYKHTITTRMPEGVAALAAIAKERTDLPGRLMVEDGPAALYGHAHLPGMLPLLSGREQIGGPYPYTILKHHFADFESESAFGRPLVSFSPAEFDSCLETYNVRLILTATKGTEDFLRRVASVSLIARSGRYSLWKVQGDFGPAFGAGVQVSSAQNLIMVTGGGSVPRVVLKYHWDKGLHAAGPSMIFPVQVGADPIPFIGLEPRGANEVRIVYE
ncbi:MAG: hypothetical protein HY770_06945, partial [Chitinivibrionia bacterium]|nr:hypothetical protein [Chitinivibrionia bacterium]